MLAVTHYREGRSIGVLETEAELTLETRGEEHSLAARRGARRGRLHRAAHAVDRFHLLDSAMTVVSSAGGRARPRHGSARAAARRSIRIEHARNESPSRSCSPTSSARRAGGPARSRGRTQPAPRVLRRSPQRARAFGGTVEKFIGDAVVACSALPLRTRTTRNARSARPSRSASGCPCERRGPGTQAPRARSGVHGRSADHSRSAAERRRSDAAGESMNTAARLQSAAPVDGVLVDETTIARQPGCHYKEHPPVDARARQSRSRPTRPSSDVALRARSRRPARGPLVGRQEESR